MLLTAHYGFGMQTQALFFAWVAFVLGIVLGIIEWLLYRQAAAKPVKDEIAQDGQAIPASETSPTKLAPLEGNAPSTYSNSAVKECK